MKKFLPKTANNFQGFTLVELLVVVSIIAFLAVIGMTAFGNAQKQARDGRRRADVDAIVKAMESNYSPIKGAYLTLTNSMFASGKIPTDPSTGNNYTTSTYPSSCTGTEASPVCTGFGVCATLENTTQGNAGGTSYDTIARLVSLTSGTTQYCRASQLNQ